MICLGPTCFTGSWITTDAGLKYASFQGIRYAKAPIGNLRFKPPQVNVFNQKDRTTNENCLVQKVTCKLFALFSKNRATNPQKLTSSSVWMHYMPCLLHAVIKMHQNVKKSYFCKAFIALFEQKVILNQLAI